MLWAPFTLVHVGTVIDRVAKFYFITASVIDIDCMFDSCLSQAVEALYQMSPDYYGYERQGEVIS